jgi:putative ABC transport system permease protein
VSSPLRTRRLIRPAALLYFYRRRLRAHGVQELLAGVGIAGAVALVLASGLTQTSVAGSTRKVVRAVIGPANLQLRARDTHGFSEALLTQVERLPGVRQSAPLLEASMHVIGPGGKTANVYIAGTDTSLSVLNGLGRTLPLNALTAGAVGLSATSAAKLGVKAGARPGNVTLLVGGVRRTLRVSAVLGPETAGVLSGALVGVTPLATMQSLLGQPRRVTRILVQTAPGHEAAVREGLQRLAGSRLIVSGAEQDVELLQQALRPSGQASALFSVIGALLGLLFAINAILLTVPERRQAIADLRLAGTTRSAIVQLAIFQALCLGVLASGVGVGVGYVLARWVFHQSTGYLAAAFALSGGTVVSTPIVVLTAVGGVLATLLASGVPLLDLRGRRPRDAIYVQGGVPGNSLTRTTQRWLSVAALALLALAIFLYAELPSRALVASVALALATVLSVPATFAGALAGAHALSERAPRLSTLAVALSGVKATTLRALALAATGAVALFGSVALGGGRANLLSGIRLFAHSYAADAPIWVGEPGDNQATQMLAGDGGAARVARVPGVASVAKFQGAFLTFGQRKLWVLARPPGGAREVLASQTIGGAAAAGVADARLAGRGWIALSQQVAQEHHAHVGSTITLPVPSGQVSFRVAALTTNLAWSPGVVFMSSSDFTAAWGTGSPSALAVTPTPGVDVQRLADQIATTLGPSSGLEVASATTREGKIDTLTREGLGQLGVIATLLVLAAIMALAAALTSSIHQRRHALASLRLAGAPAARLRRILLVEAGLVLGAGCLTGALAGGFGQFVIDAYLRHVTGFPVASASASAGPLETVALVLAAALVVVAIPGWLASRVPPALARAEE